MGVGMSLLAILEDGPSYGLQLKNEFEARTGGVWPLNVGQVYSTLGRLQRDGLVEADPSDDPDGQKLYRLTPGGRERLSAWFCQPAAGDRPRREELVLKLVMATRRSGEEALGVVQTERRGAVELLQQYTRLKRDAPADGELGWLLLLDALIFASEARVRWLDACEARLQTSSTGTGRASQPQAQEQVVAEEVPS